jgi:hypothetical protein
VTGGPGEGVARAGLPERYVLRGGLRFGTAPPGNPPCSGPHIALWKHVSRCWLLGADLVAQGRGVPPVALRISAVTKLAS